MLLLSIIGMSEGFHYCFMGLANWLEEYLLGKCKEVRFYCCVIAQGVGHDVHFTPNPGASDRW